MRYTGEHLREIAFPMGGIGSGSISLAGNGRLCDWELFNRSAKGSPNGYSCFTVRARSGGTTSLRVLNGDLQKDLVGQYCNGHYSGYGFGPFSSTMCGFPHFRDLIFDGEFPIATLTFRDENFPGTVTLTGFNPFIPLDSDNSSIPAAFFEVTFHNDTAEPVEYSGVLSVQNPFGSSVNADCSRDGIRAVQLKNAAETNPDALGYGDLTVACTIADGGDSHSGVQEYWYRGGWQDTVVMFWNELDAGKDGSALLAPRHYDAPGRNDHADVWGDFTVQPGQSRAMRFVISWNVPNVKNYWHHDPKETVKDTPWKNYYAKLFADSAASAFYALSKWDFLYGETKLFHDVLYGSTLDPVITDAAGSALAVLKSPTTLRLEDGSFYGWEGLHEKAGSCEGTCQHVWNYAYALCFLFPDLERSIRDLEMNYGTDLETGRTNFRLKLPLGIPMGDFRACVDGQMGSVVKIYREWKISGDDEWLRSHWQHVKKMLEYAWSEANYDAWDRDRDGVMEGRQHHTLDMELFGPSSWLQGFYMAALRAGEEMARYLGEDDTADDYRRLFENGYAFCRDNLFNGEYFIQKVDLEDRSELNRYEGAGHYWNDESKEIKYQIGQGCEIDQLCGQWHADLCGLGQLFDPAQVDTALHSLYRYNVKQSLREHVNPWRIYALNDEPAALNCTYPAGARKPAIPMPYCEECWTGLEYQLAGSMIAHGMVEEGIQVVRNTRARFNGFNRNPFNEFECGSNYARSMSSFGLLPLSSGFTYDLPHRTVGFAPAQIPADGVFRCFWSLATGWGQVCVSPEETAVTLCRGSLTLERLILPDAAAVKALVVDGTPVPFEVEGSALVFRTATVTESLVAKNEPPRAADGSFGIRQ